MYIKYLCVHTRAFFTMMAKRSNFMREGRTRKCCENDETNSICCWCCLLSLMMMMLTLSVKFTWQFDRIMWQGFVHTREEGTRRTFLAFIKLEIAISLVMTFVFFWVVNSSQNIPQGINCICCIKNSVINLLTSPPSLSSIKNTQKQPTFLVK